MYITLKTTKVNKLDKQKDTKGAVAPECSHENVYVAVRHVSGIRLYKCKDCNKVVN